MAIYNPNLLDNNIISSRVRLARNLKGYAFNITNEAEANEVVKLINRAVVKVDTYNLYFMRNMSLLKLTAMKEKYLISQKLIDNYDRGAVLISRDECVSIMIHEEDVIREQCFMRGLKLTEAYKRLDKVDEELSKNLNLAFDKELGFLTACPTNLGTGLRASVMLFLPALSLSGKIHGVIKKVEDLGLTVRGVYGEGSKAEGYMYQISNEVTLGVSEYTILNTVEEAVLKVCEAERLTLKELYSDNLLETKDKVKRAFGILSSCAVLSYSEFLSLIATVKLGVCLNLINLKHPEAIDDLIVAVRPGNICEKMGRELTALERDVARAELVGNQIMKIKG